MRNPHEDGRTSKLKKLGEILENRRKQKGFSKRELAKMINVTPTYIAQIEKGERNATIMVYEKLSKELELPLPMLFWAAVPAEDIPESKRSEFRVIQQVVSDLMANLYLKTA